MCEWGSLSDTHPFMAMNILKVQIVLGCLFSVIGLEICDRAWFSKSVCPVTSEDHCNESRSLWLGTKKQLSQGVGKELRLFC